MNDPLANEWSLSCRRLQQRHINIIILFGCLCFSVRKALFKTLDFSDQFKSFQYNADSLFKFTNSGTGQSPVRKNLKIYLALNTQPKSYDVRKSRNTQNASLWCLHSPTLFAIKHLRFSMQKCYDQHKETPLPKSCI